MKHTLIAILITLVSSIALSNDGPVWKDRDGNAVPNSESEKVENGFSGMLVITPDSDWAEKWDTPQEVAPHFGSTETVRVGENITTLIFFANPLVGDDGDALVLCDLQVIRPGGSFSINEKNLECYRGPVPSGTEYNIRLATTVLGFVGEPTDELGEWLTKVKLTDIHRNVSLDLTSRFTLIASET